MPVTYHKQDEWDKLFEKFAKFDELEAVTFPDPQAKATKQVQPDAKEV
ncbi:SPJ_0845 family protein [Streptococcus ovuberis]|uniref:Uncharacterized protein n=1 Tax=Streptococcus ovuberis TaxID=1936207 RepID=A0A7X6N0Z1_9STRE|nr:SPJ_0845 family protein [Streptococcus ovuberis]NKZ21041.1 hypothetical protein [Streptococcus ovuberis]